METNTPTQVAHPIRAVLRTAVAVIVTLATILPVAWSIIGEELANAGVVIPDNVGAVVAGAIALVVAVSGILTRIMALPAVDDMLAIFGLSAQPQSEPRRALDE